MSKQEALSEEEFRNIKTRTWQVDEADFEIVGKLIAEIDRLRAESAELKALLRECEGPLKRLCSSFSGMVNDAVFGKAYTADCSSLRTLLTRIRAAIGEGK